MRVIDIENITEAMRDDTRFVLRCEEVFHDKISAAAASILMNKSKKPLVCLTGPSGSGKTTTAMRLKAYLENLGVKVCLLSMDNFFLPLADRPPELTDWESPLCVNRDLLIDCIHRLSDGEEVELPIYDFKSGAVSSAQKISNRKVLGEIPDLSSTSIHPCYAEETGEILYFVDNCEDITFENLTVEDFDRTGYKKNQITNGNRITAGDPAYKIVTDENWSVAIHVASAEEANELVKKGYIQVRFLENQMVSWASVSSRSDENDNYYVNLRFNNSMSEFCSDRFVNVELISSQRSGLKVPNSSITKGTFFLVPKGFVYEGAGGQKGVLLEIYTENNEKSIQFVPSVPYSENEDYYYLDDSVLRAGEIIDRPNSSEQYTIGEKDELIGVYYINKGYPDFRQVNILHQNEEYAIVEPNSLYGLQEYDYIVLYADSVKINDYYR